MSRVAIEPSLLATVPPKALGRDEGRELLYLERAGSGLTVKRGNVKESEHIDTNLYRVSEAVREYLATWELKKPPELNLSEKVTFFLHADQLEQSNLRRNTKIDESICLLILEIVVRILTLGFVSVRENMKNPLLGLQEKIDVYFGTTGWRGLLEEVAARNGGFPKTLAARFEHKHVHETQELMSGEMKQRAEDIFILFLTEEEFSIVDFDFTVDDVGKMSEVFSAGAKGRAAFRRVEREKLGEMFETQAKAKSEFLYLEGPQKEKIAFRKRDTLWEVLWAKGDYLYQREYPSIPDKQGDLFLRQEATAILDKTFKMTQEQWKVYAKSATLE